MGQVVYADLLFFINFSMDFLCFYISSRLLHERIKPLRTVMGAAVGALYAVLAVLRQESGVLALAADLLICVLMCAIAFWPGRCSWGRFLRFVILYVVVSMLMGGVMTALFSLLNRLSLPFEENGTEDDVSVWAFGLLAALSGALTLFSGRLWRRESVRRTARLDIVYRRREVHLRAMVDSGNLLRDPLAGQCVVVVDAKAAEALFDDGLLPLLLSGEITRYTDPQRLKGLRFISADSATGKRLMCALSPDKMTLWDGNGHSREVKALFAPASGLSEGADGYEALIPSELMI